MRVIRRLSVTLLALAVVAGPPAAALAWLTAAPPTLPSADTGRRLAADPLSSTGLLAGLLLLGALAWLALATLVVAGTLRRLRAGLHRLHGLPLPTPAQATATSLAGAAAFGVPAATTVGHAPAVAPGPAAAGEPTGTAAVIDGRDGVTLADGGWLPAEVAGQVSATASLVWLRRRLRYRPTPVHPDRSAPLQLPATVTAIQAAIPPAAGLAGGLLPATALPAGSVRLTGPGAADAARGLLITLLLRPPAATRVVTTRATLTLLLDTAAGPQLPGLLVVDHPSAALTAAAAAASGDRSTDTAVPSITVLLADCPEQPPAPVAGLTVVTCNGPDTTAAWHVAADGTVQGDSPAAGTRLCMLPGRAAADLLDLIRLAQPADPTAPGAPAQVQPPPVGGSAPARRPGTEPAVRLRVLGAPTLTAGTDVVPVRRSAAWQILVLLATRPHGATADELATAVWPGLRPHTVRNRLYTTISELRRTLHDTTGVPVLHRHADSYRLDPSHLEVDLWQLHAAAAATVTALTADDRRAALQQIITTNRGELAAGEAWPWLAGPRETVRQLVLDAYTDLAATAGPQEQLRLLRAALTVDPYNAEVCRRAITALAGRGDPTGAVQLHDAYLRRLAAAGLTPSAELTELAEQLRHHPSRSR